MDKHSNKRQSEKQNNQQQVSKGYLERQVEQMYHIDNEFGYDLGPSQPLDKKNSHLGSNKKYSQSQATKNMNRR